MLRKEKSLNKKLLDAAQSNDTERIKFLLDEGANINATNQIGDTPLHKDLFQELFDRDLKLVTKKGMKNALMPLNEKILLRKRSIIETVFDYLKNKFEISAYNSCEFFGAHSFHPCFIFLENQKALYFLLLLRWLIHSWR